jgi:membrane-associated phospholipid phosphatase
MRRGIAEVFLAVAAYIAYSLSCGAVPAHRDLAFANADRVIALEGWMRILVERQMQLPVLPHAWLVQVFNAIYMWGHLPLIIAVLAWLFIWYRPQYRLMRNAMLVSGAIGLILFYGVPLAPPRLVPSLHIVDTAALIAPVYDTVEPKVFFNPYAAMPSMHIAWDLLMGLAVVWCARSYVTRWFGALLPVAMLAAVVITGNHYLVDGIAGAAVGLVGLGAAVGMQILAVGGGVTSPLSNRTPNRTAAEHVQLRRPAPGILPVGTATIGSEHEDEN